MDDLISRQAAIDAVKKHYRTHDNDLLELIAFDIERLPPAQGKPFNLPEIYIADGYDTIEGEDGNVGFGVYVPDENQIYVAGDVEGEIRARALLHEICHWVQAMCGRSFDEDEANEFSDIVYDALPSAQATHEERTETHACDLISRQAAIDELDKGAWGVEWDKTLAKTMIESLPSAQPELRWIPCSERLPEEKINPNTKDFEKVLCTTVFGNVRAYAFGTPIGTKEPHFWNGPECVDKYVVAWQYMPEPYQAESEEA